VDPVTGFTGNPCGEITVNGNANYRTRSGPVANRRVACLIVNAILGIVDFMGVEQSV
jgi:hypothetical protein